MIYLGIFIFWFVVFGVVTAAVAKSRGHEPAPWFVFGGLLFIVALPLAFFLTPPGLERNAAQRACPYCGRKINSGAHQCPACGRGQPQTATTSQSAWEKTVGADDEVSRWSQSPDKK